MADPGPAAPAEPVATTAAAAVAATTTAVRRRIRARLTSGDRLGAYPQRVIVVIGSPIGRLDDDVLAAGGTASRVALAAARLGRTVQLVGKTGDDPTADGVVLDLARGGVGHVALLRDPARATPLETVAPDAIDEDAADGRPGSPGDAAARARPAGPALEAADVELGLRYLTDFAVVVLAEPAEPQTIVAVVADAARWGEARMILVVGAGETVPDGLPGEVTVFESPTSDPDGAFADLVGTFAAVDRRRDRAGRGVPQLDRVRRVDRGRRRLTGVEAAETSGTISSGPSRRTSLTKRSTA